MTDQMTDERALKWVFWIKGRGARKIPSGAKSLAEYEAALDHIASRLQAQQPRGGWWRVKLPAGRSEDGLSTRRKASDQSFDDGFNTALNEVRKLNPPQRIAQQPGAQAVAWAVQLADGSISDLGWLDMRSHDWCAKSAVLRDGARYVYAYFPKTPSIPEPSDADVRAFIDAVNPMLHPLPPPGVIRAALATYTARLRERIGGAV